MTKLVNEFIEVGAVDDRSIKLRNNNYMVARNAADTADISVIKLNASDRIELPTVPQVTADPATGNDLTRQSWVNTQLGNYIPTSQKGANSGVATLDGGGKIPATQLPNSVMEYKGNWAASTNTPTLADGTGNAGDVYKASDAGTVDFGAGNITFAAGDFVIYSGSVWEKSINSNAVVSVNGQTGVVVLTTTNISEGTNLYFTASAARTAAVVNSTAGTETDQAASVSAMKSYVTGQVSSGVVTKNEQFTLSGTNITNGYVDLTQVAKTDSVNLFPKGGLPQVAGVDYTLSYTGGAGSKTRVTFAGDLATTLVAGHVLVISYIQA